MMNRKSWLRAGRSAAVCLLGMAVCAGAADQEADWSKAKEEVKEAASAVGEASSVTAKDVWRSTKEESKEAWDKTKKGSKEAWDKGKAESNEVLDQVRQKVHEATAPPVSEEPSAPDTVPEAEPAGPELEKPSTE